MKGPEKFLPEYFTFSCFSCRNKNPDDFGKAALDRPNFSPQISF